MAIRRGLMNWTWLVRLRRLVLGKPSGELVLRTAPTRVVAELWVSLLGDHGIPARAVPALPASFMGDGMQHRVIVRGEHADEAERILRALWDATRP